MTLVIFSEYHSYWRTTEKRARQAAEKQTQQAKQRTEQLAQKLRALGINPDDI